MEEWDEVLVRFRCRENDMGGGPRDARRKIEV